MTIQEAAMQGLECCQRRDGNQCKVCPYTESDWCTEDMASDALRVIKDQQKTIEELNGFLKNAAYVTTCKNCVFGYPLTDSAYILCTRRFHDGQRHDANWFCADGEEKK